MFRETSQSLHVETAVLRDPVIILRTAIQVILLFGAAAGFAARLGVTTALVPAPAFVSQALPLSRLG